jgi:putative signal transducing protein
MTPDPNEVVTVYSGSLVVVEAYKQALADAGIESKMTGDSLLASFGSAVPGAVELFVHQRDFERARAAIERYDQERGNRPTGGREHPHPKDEPGPDSTRHRQKHHIPPHPTGE